MERVTRLFAGGEPYQNGFAWKMRDVCVKFSKREIR
jgi:hypothetical protein